MTICNKFHNIQKFGLLLNFIQNHKFARQVEQANWILMQSYPFIWIIQVEVSDIQV
ncbi:MAG: hypothetical protein M1539_03185 [Actinobacteria bacterium]|nr:hypothetical protein [Actinomycetota bacterium]